MSEKKFWPNVRDAVSIITGGKEAVWRVENKVVTPGMFDAFMIKPFPAWLEFKWSNRYNRSTEIFHLDHKFSLDQYRFAKRIFDPEQDALRVAAFLVIGSEDLVAVYSGAMLASLVDVSRIPLETSIGESANNPADIARMLMRISETVW